MGPRLIHSLYFINAVRIYGYTDLLVGSDCLLLCGFRWRRHFGRVAEFAEFVALALNGAVIAE